MHEDYIDRDPRIGRRRKEKTATIVLRVPESWKAQLEAHAQVEEDTLSGLVLEGIMRVIDSRNADPQHRERLLADAQRRLTEAQQTISELTQSPVETQDSNE